MLPMVNRSAIVLRPKEPFKAWLRSCLERDGAVTDIEAAIAGAGGKDRTVYLIPDYHDDGEAREVLEEFAPLLFEQELSSWDEDEESWPSERGFEQFQEWFDYELLSLVVDTWDEALELT